MKKTILGLAALLLTLAAFKYDKPEETLIRDNFRLAGKQLKQMLGDAARQPNAFPKTMNNGGRLVSTNMYDWTSGFFPGNLWLAYEYTQDTTLRRAAQEWTEKLTPLQYFKEHHDLGFMMYCSFGNAYRLTGNAAYRDILVQSARSLSTRFDPRVGSIKSWNMFKSWHGNKTYSFPVIIDNMMNLELLFFASKTTGDTSFRHIAVTHAENAMKHQIRPDFSSYHVVCYDTATGAVTGRETAQGWSDNSTWSRGQAWGIYGFTMCYRETKDPRFLRTARGMADFFIGHKNLPADKIPYWDFNIFQPGYTPGVKSNANQSTDSLRDASAAAITASALLELSEHLGKDGARYREAAVQMLHSLSHAPYRAALGANANFLLTQSVGSIPHNAEVDAPLVYADYYFLEALYRYHQLLQGQRIAGI
ncbi:glycoside hydrolase family 88 protein [Chitinophaga lutea]